MRKLDLPPDSRGNTFTTGQTFVTAQEELEPLVPPTEADAVSLVDVGEVSSPNKLMKWKRQTERLQAGQIGTYAHCLTSLLQGAHDETFCTQMPYTSRRAELYM